MGPTFLALATGSDTSTGLVPIVTGMGNLVNIMGEVWEVMVSNPLLVTFLGASLFFVGIKMFRKIKSAAKG